MSTLLPVLATISLLDSTSMIPIAVLPLAIILGGHRPVFGASSFMAGIFTVYLTCGLVLLLGLDALLGAWGPTLERWYNQPNVPELIVQIVVGALMLVFGWRLAAPRKVERRPEVPASITPGGAFVLGASLMLIGLPGAFPYFGAIDQILRVDLSLVGSGIALVFYNAVFLVPLLSLLAVRLIVPGRSDEIFRWVASFAERWGGHAIVAILMLLGAVLVADGIGWLFGHPIIPLP
jgi:cytochrome c biogenesis protein CcdA